MGRLPSRPNGAIRAAIRPQPLTSLPTTFDMTDPGTILAILKGVAVATTTVYRAIDDLGREEQQALKALIRVIEGLKSDTAVYETLLKTMVDDTHPDTNPLGPPPTSPTATSASTSAPHAPTGPQNADTHVLPPSWVLKYGHE